MAGQIRISTVYAMRRHRDDVFGRKRDGYVYSRNRPHGFEELGRIAHLQFSADRIQMALVEQERLASRYCDGLEGFEVTHWVTKEKTTIWEDFRISAERQLKECRQLLSLFRTAYDDQLAISTSKHNDSNDRTMLFLAIAAVLLALVALMPEGPRKEFWTQLVNSLHWVETHSKEVWHQCFGNSN